MKRFSIIFFTAMIISTAYAETQEYRSTAIDNNGQLHITTSEGQIIDPKKFDGQISFEQAAISPDKQVIGWFADFNLNDGNGTPFPVATRIVLFKNGKVLHLIDAEQTFWDWQFRKDGKQIAYCEGPTHFGVSVCRLSDVDTGKMVQEWDALAHKNSPPAWSLGLHGVDKP